MLFFKKPKGQVTLNFIFAFFAAVVILGALFKIRHWPYADEMITLGLLSEVIVFLVMAFLVPPPEEPHWQRYFPDINVHPDLEPNFKPTPLTLPGAGGNPALTKLEDMLRDADITPANLGRLGENFKKFGGTVDKMSDITDVVAATGDYTSKTVLPPGGSAGNGGGGGGRGFGQTVSGNSQGYSKPTGGVDAALKYEFLKNKAASLTLSVNDIFRTRVSDVYTESDYFTQTVVRRRDPQIFRLQFNYRFGKFDVAEKNLNGQNQTVRKNRREISGLKRNR